MAEDRSLDKPVDNRMPLVEVPGVFYIIVRFSLHKTRESLAAVSKETKKLAAEVWALDSRQRLAAYGIAVRTTVALVLCPSELVQGNLGFAAAESGDQFIMCVPQCGALFFAKREHSGDFIVALHFDDSHAEVVGWKQAVECSQRPITTPATALPTIVSISQQWEVRVGSDTVASMALSGDTIAIGSYSDKMTLLNAHTGAVVTDALKGALVAFLGEDRVVGVMEHVLREFTAGILTKVVPLEIERIVSVKASANGKRLYVVDGDNNQLLVFCTAKWQLIATIALSGIPYGKCDIANGVLAQCILEPEKGAEGQSFFDIELVETNTRCVTQSIGTAHRSSIRAVALSPDATRLVSVSTDWSAQLFDAVTGEMLGEPREGHSDDVLCVCWLSNQCFVTVSRNNAEILVWHCDSQQAIGGVDYAHDERISYVLRLSNDSFVTGAWNGSVKKWTIDFKSTTKKRRKVAGSSLPAAIPVPMRVLPTVGRCFECNEASNTFSSCGHVCFCLRCFCAADRSHMSSSQCPACAKSLILSVDL